MGPSFYQRNIIDRVPELLDRLEGPPAARENHRRAADDTHLAQQEVVAVSDDDGPLPATQAQPQQWLQPESAAADVEPDASDTSDPDFAAGGVEWSIALDAKVDVESEDEAEAESEVLGEAIPEPETVMVPAAPDLPEFRGGAELADRLELDRPADRISVAAPMTLGMTQTLRQQADPIFLGPLEPPRPSPLVSVTINAPQPPREEPPAPRGPGPAARAWAAAWDTLTRNARARAELRYAATVIAAVGAGAVFLLYSLVSVPQGTVGVRSGIGSQASAVLSPGPYVVIPGISGLSLYATGELGREIQMSGLFTADGFTVPATSVKVAYRVEPDAIGSVIGLESEPAVRPDGVVLPMAEKVSRDVERIFGAMVGMVESDRLASMRVKMGMLLHEELQASLDTWVPGAVRIVGVDVGTLRLGVPAESAQAIASVPPPPMVANSRAKAGLMPADDGY